MALDLLLSAMRGPKGSFTGSSVCAVSGNHMEYCENNYNLLYLTSGLPFIMYCI